VTTATNHEKQAAMSYAMVSQSPGVSIDWHHASNGNSVTTRSRA